MSFTLAIVGRPNVGKSTLFNRLVGRKLALVDDQPGVTRDLREGAARLGDLRFTVIDTAGLEDATDDSLPGRMRRLTESAVDAADVCLFLVDARAGITAADEVLAELLRRRAKAVILAANKAEGRAGEAGVLDAWRLGLGEPIRLSAEHGEGLEDLYRALLPHAEAAEAEARAEAAAEPETDVDVADDAEGEGTGEGAAAARAPSPARPLQIAVIGRPNAGKSTLVNRILGQERLLTGPEAGITRDAIAVETLWEGTPVRVFDTAGIRRRSKVVEKLEKLSVADALRAVRFAEVVILLLDAQIPFETQDLRLADLAEREGRAVVIAVNKWDLTEDRAARLAELRAMLERLLPQLAGVPFVAVSALTGQGMERLHAAVRAAYDVWNRRIPTARLNAWLQEMVVAHPPPAPGGRRIRLRYMTQVKTRPPGFVIMATQADRLPEAYIRYLVNGLRAAFDLPGVPIRVTLRNQSAQNPFRDRKAPRPGAAGRPRGPRGARRGVRGG